MTERIIATLAIGTKFLQMALGCMISAERFCGRRFRYVVFTAWSDTDLFDKPDFIELVDIAPIIAKRSARELYSNRYRILSPAEVIQDGFAARELKGIPLTHPDFLDDEIVFLDADMIVFEDCFDEVFSFISDHSIATTDSNVLDPDTPLYHWPSVEWTFNLREQARLVGFDIINRHVHTGLVGRGCDPVARYIALTFDYLLQVKPLPLFPQNVRYFNDEAYFAFALSLAAARFPGHDFNGLPNPNLLKTTLNKTMLGREELTGKPILGSKADSSVRDTRYSILHFHTITTWDSEFYREWLDGTCPELLRRTK